MLLEAWEYRQWIHHVSLPPYAWPQIIYCMGFYANTVLDNFKFHNFLNILKTTNLKKKQNLQKIKRWNSAISRLILNRMGNLVLAASTVL